MDEASEIVSEASWFDAIDEALSEDEEEHQADAILALAFAAGQEIDIDDNELNGAVKRSLFVLAAGGDPRRGIDLDGRAVETIAEDLDSPARRATLTDGVAALRARAGDRAAVVDVLVALEADGELAWRAFAAARLALSLADDD